MSGYEVLARPSEARVADRSSPDGDAAAPAHVAPVLRLFLDVLTPEQADVRQILIFLRDVSPEISRLRPAPTSHTSFASPMPSWLGRTFEPSAVMPGVLR